MIQGYPDDSSAFPGETINFHVSTDAPQFRIDFYRQGASLNLYLSTDWLEGVFADEHDPWQDWGIAAMRSDGTKVAAWHPSPFIIPEDWQSGVYIAMFVEGDGQGNPNPSQDPPIDTGTADARTGKALFVVKNPSPGVTSQILYKIPLFTYQSYNYQGGGSIYQGVDVTLHRPGGGTGGTPWDSREASIWPVPGGEGNPDPFDLATPRQTFVHWDAKMIFWLESNGYRVDYCTDMDIHSDINLKLLGPYALVLSVGHDEYYSVNMRNNLADYITSGGNIAFFSGNTCWWRTEFSNNDPFLMLGQQTIKLWGYPSGVGLPEDSLTGVSFRNGGERNYPLPNTDNTKVGYTVQNTNLWPFENSGLNENDTFGKDRSIVGYECDGTFYDKTGPRPFVPKFLQGDTTPPGLVILGTGATSSWPLDGNVESIDADGNVILSNNAATMTLFNNAGTVFSGATTDWPRVVWEGDAPTVAVTRNVLDRMGGNPKGLAQLSSIPNIICCDGFFSADDNFRHAVVGGGDGNITEIAFSPVSGQAQGISAYQNGLLDLGGFTSDDDQFRHIVAVAFDGNIWAMPYAADQQQPVQIILVNIPNAFRVCGFYTPDDNFRHAIVATSDGNVFEVYYQGIGNTASQTLLGTFDNIVDVGGFFSPDDNYRHAIIGTADGNVTEIYFNPDIGISQTVIAIVPDLAKVSAYYAANDNFFTRRVQVLTNGGRVHEIRYGSHTDIMRVLLFNTGGLVDIGSFYSSEDNFRHSILTTLAGDVQELFFNP